MTERSRPVDEVLIPDVVGLVVDDARAVAVAAGVVLAQPDPGTARPWPRSPGSSRSP